MVICKYFQQGYCRYGQNCRFEHVYGSKYNYHAAPPPTTQAPGVTDEQLVNQVKSDVQAALKGGQWILSSYAPFKEKPVFPGITDLSPEEARLFIYEAKASNNIEQAIAYMNNIVNETRYKYEQLLQPTLAMIKVLRSIYKGEPVGSPFTAQNSAFGAPTNTPSSIFHNAAQNANVFGQNNAANNFFGGQPNANVFGSPDNSVAKSIFSQATQNAFGQSPTQGSQNVFGPSHPSNVFGSPSAESGPKSIFSQANQSIFGNQNAQNNPASVFASANQFVTSDPFGQKQNSPFGNAQPSVSHFDPFSQKQETPFGNPQNVFQDQKPGFGSNVFQQMTTADETGVYSNVADLSNEDLEDFKSEEFKLGFIPEVPPPRALCF